MLLPVVGWGRGHTTKTLALDYARGMGIQGTPGVHFASKCVSVCPKWDYKSS